MQAAEAADTKRLPGLPGHRLRRMRIGAKDLPQEQPFGRHLQPLRRQIGHQPGIPTQIAERDCINRNSRRFHGLRKALCCQLTTGNPSHIPANCPSNVARVSDVHKWVASNARASG